MKTKETKLISKYTHIKYLPDYLCGKLYVSGGEGWEDKNDLHAIKLARIRVKDVRVACLTTSQDRFHFWKLYTKNGSDAECYIRIVFNKRHLIDSVKNSNEQKYIAMGKVSYIKKDDYRYPNKTKINLDCNNIRTEDYYRDIRPLFAKRFHFESEKEYRFVEINNEDKFVNYDKESIKCIYTNPWDDGRIKEYIEHIISLNDIYNDIEVKKSLITGSSEFKKFLSSLQLHKY